jgi:WD40 repeat protein
MDGARLGFNLTGNTLAAAVDSRLIVWDMLPRNVKSTMRLCDGGPLALTVSRSGSNIAVGYDTGFVGLAHRTSRRWETRCIRTHTSLVQGLAFNPNGTALATSGMISDTDRKIRIIKPNDGQTIAGPFGRHRGPIKALVFSADGTMLLSAGTDDTIDMWDPTTATPLGPVLRGQPAGTNGLSFDPHGVALVTSTDETVTIWDFDLASWRQLACRAASRTLTEAERERYIGGAESIACSELSK